jgi:3-hydroxyisobutyrate dehydrogenase-like beta-hydroxyacid dehydrogenase
MTTRSESLPANSDEPRLITVIGAGRMGAAIARTLAANGAVVRVWNRTYSRAAALAAERLTPVVDLAEAVRGADAVVSLLSAGPAVRATVGVLGHHLAKHTVVIEASTIDPITMADVAGTLTVPVLSCAVSGTPAVVTAGNASVMVSGTEEARSLAGPFLTLFAARVVEVGDRVEDAKLVKIGINAVLAGTMELLAESAVLLEAGGVDRAVFADALAGSVLASTFSGYKLAALVQRDYTPTFATRDLRKDVALALSQGQASGVELPFAERLLGLLEETIAYGWGDVDFLSVAARLQVSNGLRCDLPVQASAEAAK